MKALCILGIVLAVLLLAALLPLGVDLAYQTPPETGQGGGMNLWLRVGFLRFRLLPKKKPKKPKKKKKPAKAEKPKPASNHPQASKPEGGKAKRGLSDYLELAGVVLKAASRFRRRVRVDRLRFCYVCAAEDPYDAIMNYGRLNAGISVLLPLLHRWIDLREELVALDVDVFSDRSRLDTRLTVTLRLWQWIEVGVVALTGLLRWRRARRGAQTDNSANSAQK